MNNGFFKVSGSSGLGAQPKQFAYDLTKSQTRAVYNTGATKAELVQKEMGFGQKLFHEGVLTTDNNGHKWLLHKGPDYGKESSTVLVDAKHMSSKYKVVQSLPVDGKTIGDLVKAGYPDKPYSIIPGAGKHCQDAARNIMKEAGKK